VRGAFRRVSDRILAADWLWSAALIVVGVVLLGSQSCERGYGDLQVGQIVPYDVMAARDVDVVDRVLTEERRRHARERIPEIYVHDTERGPNLVGELASLFDQGRRALEEASLQGAEEPAAAVTRLLAHRVPAEALDTLIELRFDPSVERMLTGTLDEVMRGLVIGNKSLLELESVILLMRLPGNEPREISRYDSFLDQAEAREEVRRAVGRSLELPDPVTRALADLTAGFVDANVNFDPEATSQRRQAEAEREPPVLVRVAKGDLVLRKGEVVTREHQDKVLAMAQEGRGQTGIRSTLALLFLVSTLAFFLFRYSAYHQRRFRKIEHLHALMVLLMLSTLVLAQAMLWLAREVVDSLNSPFNHLSTYTYLIPLGAGSILIALLANGRIAIVYSSFTALLFGAMNNWDSYTMVWAMIVQCAGVYAISTSRERTALLRAGFVVGTAGAVTTLALETLKGNLDMLPRTLYGAGLAFLGGAVGVGLLVSFALPLLEGMFKVLTDIRLLELSNINNPLLSQLAVQAPGSYNHSLVVGTLAEEAAKAIGASSLFCRVAAFYHDIGKVNKPEYYVENQRGANPHDRLSPSMSALIIASHVKDGIKMAREAGLPEQIVDIIPQHHGTKLMTFFYEKAKSSADPAMGPVKEEDFRYPGPKPQTREAAIFMLADAVEAAARTVEEPTPNRLSDMIRKVSNAIVLDGQLDDCELTFADLQRIQGAFLRLLVSMYHHRVDYPGFDFGKPKGESRPQDELRARRMARGT
jgi:putative nucleotidyltransferase with HDIG domain